MSIAGMKREIPTMAGEARAIISATKNEEQRKLAEDLFKSIETLNEAVAHFERGERPDANAEKIGEKMQEIANIVTVLSSKTTLDIHERLNVIFKMLKAMKAEGTDRDNPLVALWLAKGMKKGRNEL